jgi:Flp pilus assembly CpaE family ATPase
LLITLSILLLAVSIPVGVGGIFMGLAVFALANYVATALEQPAWLDSVLADRIFVASIVLALVIIIAAG